MATQRLFSPQNRLPTSQAAKSKNFIKANIKKAGVSKEKKGRAFDSTGQNDGLVSPRNQFGKKREVMVSKKMIGQAKDITGTTGGT